MRARLSAFPIPFVRMDPGFAAHTGELQKKRLCGTGGIPAVFQPERNEVLRLEDDEDIEEEPDNGNYKVKRPRPIADGGSSYITGRKAEAEARKAEEERLAKRRAANKKKKK